MNKAQKQQILLKKRSEPTKRTSFVIPDEPTVKDVSSEISEISKEYNLHLQKERLHSKKTLDLASEGDKVEKYST